MPDADLPPAPDPAPGVRAATPDAQDRQRTEEHVQGWWQITSALSEATTPESVTAAVVQRGLEAMGAAAGSVLLPTPDGRSLSIAGSSGYPAQVLESWRLTPLTMLTPATVAYRSAEPLFIESKAQALRDYPALDGVVQDRTLSLAALPLLVRGTVLGVLLLSFTRQRTFDELDRTFLRSLAAQCAQALQRSAALQEAERLNGQLSFLAEASEVLSGSLELTATLDSIARLTVPRLTDWCVVYLPSGEVLTPVTVVHQDPAQVAFLQDFIGRYPAYIGSRSSSVARVYRTGQPELIAAFTDEMYDALPQPEHWKRDLRRLGLRSVITVPMLGRGRVVGVLGFGRTDLARAYRPEDLGFALELARRAGSAVENAELYGQAQREIGQRREAQQALDRANAELEERVRERTRELEAVNGELEAFAYSASHDLRTPVRHIVSFSELLARRLKRAAGRAAEERSAGDGNTDGSTAKIDLLLGQIQQAAERLSATIDGLLNLSRASRIPLERRSVDLGRLVAETVESLNADLAAQNKAVEWRVGELPQVQGEPSLLRLVIANLLDNAVKYSRPREQAVIEVSASELPDAHHITVRDNGVGFDPAYAGKLFTAFQRLHHPGEFGGTGIGLANVRRIVLRHQGQIWAESQPGQGASFTFSLPKVPVAAGPVS